MTANDQPALFSALRHAFFWLMVANGVGVLLSLLLLWPDANLLLGERTHGRWLPLHLNLQLYGWTSLPLVAWLFRIYRVDATSSFRWGMVAIWLWSAALAAGGLGWLSGKTSGKIFLDWSGRNLALYVTALMVLWVVLLRGWWKSGRGRFRLLGILGLACVPPMMVYAAGREVYPPVNPDTGGPTGASLLGSSLSIVFLLLVLPGSLGRSAVRGGSSRLYWLVFLLQLAAVPFLENPRGSHHDIAQSGGLGLLLVWIPLLPAYFRRFDWGKSEKLWLHASLVWLLTLVLSGWIEFLPGILDRGKFTHALVGHSHLAMAGFTSTFLLFLATVLLEGKASFDRQFLWWNLGAALFVILMLLLGAFEAADPLWLVRGETTRTVFFAGRLLCGLLLFAVSIHWWRMLVAADFQASPSR